MNKVAVAIVHGIGDTPADFANDMITELTTLRRFMVSFAADALAYQPLPDERSIYDAIHAKYAETLKVLTLKAGASAPLVVLSHSLGTIVTSNYFYDLSRPSLLPESVTDVHGDEPTPLEKGRTLTALFTFGSPIALWSLRFKDFGKPITVPAPSVPAEIAKAGGWYNFYDPDDVIGYPLRTLNSAYRAAVKQDLALNAGGIFTSWNPLSHTEYWTDNDVTQPIGDTLAKVWRAANP
ncbi:MAG: chemotaxis protein [Verrucomicrobia bacterium]|nr:chemotaxis protein [Verrucomicrobiota bacterium]